VRKIKEALRLKFEVGLGLRQIARRLFDWPRHQFKPRLVPCPVWALARSDPPPLSKNDPARMWA